jgi:hypothetical protein
MTLLVIPLLRPNCSQWRMLPVSIRLQRVPETLVDLGESLCNYRSLLLLFSASESRMRIKWVWYSSFDSVYTSFLVRAVFRPRCN